jgi:hypothetical protein
LRRVNPRGRMPGNGDRSWALDRKSSNICKPVRDTSMKKNGLVMKRGKTGLR